MLDKLNVISKFMAECVLQVVLGDMAMLVECYLDETAKNMVNSSDLII